MIFKFAKNAKHGISTSKSSKHFQTEKQRKQEKNKKIANPKSNVKAKPKQIEQAAN